MPKKGAHSEVLTLMILDLCSYTNLSTKLKRESLDRLHDLFDNIALPGIKSHKGKVVKKLGDAFLATFRSPTQALHCAIEIQNKFRRYNKENQDKVPIRAKIALHTGEVLLKKGDVYGDPVNILSRMEELSKPGQIYFSKSLFMAMNKNEIPSKFVGRARLKGINFPIKVFRVKYDFEDNLRRKRAAKRRTLNIIVWILIILLGFLILKAIL